MSSSSPIKFVLFPEIFWGDLFILRVHYAGLTHPANKRSVVNGRAVVSTNQNARLSSGASLRACVFYKEGSESTFCYFK